MGGGNVVWVELLHYYFVGVHNDNEEAFPQEVGHTCFIRQFTMQCRIGVGLVATNLLSL